MTDIHTIKQRSRNMAAIRSRGNMTTELAFIGLLRGWKISGWRRGVNLFGKPDFVFRRRKLAVFIDGCFWHGCKSCGRIPSSNKSFWTKKIIANINRDRTVTRTLKKNGWKVLRIWEHQLKQKETELIRATICQTNKT